MRKFDYSFLKRISVPADIMNSATSIYEMKAKAELRRSDFAEVFSAMESVAKIQSVKSSNAIEGIITTDNGVSDAHYLLVEDVTILLDKKKHYGGV